MTLFLSAILRLFLTAPAQAFPEMVRYHYVNCNACHVSPSGGGVLNDYGRGMSAEVLSTWSYENEALFAHGLLKPEKMPSFLNIGGDVRALQLHETSPTSVDGRYILMQSQVEAAATAGVFTADAAYGEPDAQNHITGGFDRWFLMASPLEGIQIRAGRFVPAFGINVAQHTYPTRMPLGFYYEPRSTLQVDYSGEQWHSAVSASESSPDMMTHEVERGASFQLERFFADSYRVGFSVFNGESDLSKRWATAIHGILGFTEHWYLLSELAWQSKRQKEPATPRENGIYQYNRLGYEITKGVHLLAIEQFEETNLKSAPTQMVSGGLGALWYPRPHFEFEFAWNKQRTLSTSRSFEDYAYLMAHYYL